MPSVSPPDTEQPANLRPLVENGNAENGNAENGNAENGNAENGKYSPLTRHPQPDEERLPKHEVRFGMARIITAAGFSAAFMNLTAGAVYTAFARALGANDFQFGLLAASVPLMSFLQVLSARLVETTGRRKQQMLISGITGRSLWIVAALLPLAQRQWPQLIPADSVLPLFMGCVLLSSAFQAFTSPPFFSWMSDLVPNKVRPTFLARRLQTAMYVALLAALGSGWLADTYAHISVYSIILALAGVAGVLDIALFIGIKEPTSQVYVEGNAVAPERFWSSLREPLRDASVRTFFLFTATTMFSLGLLGPFLWLHMLENLDFSKTASGLILNVTPMLSMALTLGFWGSFIQKHGTRPAQRLASAGMVIVPIGWLMAGPESQWLLVFLTATSGSLFGAIELCNQSLIMGLARHVPRSTMTALFAICAGTSFALAACLAGQVSQWLANMQWDIFGLTLVNFHVLFLTSLVIRIWNSAFIAPRLHDPTSTATRVALRGIMPDLAESVSARITRVFGVDVLRRRADEDED